MPLFEQFSQRIRAIPDPHEYVIQGVRQAVERSGADWTDVSGYIAEYEKRCTEHLRTFDFAALPSDVAWLERALLDFAVKPRNELREIASRESIFDRGRYAGWISEEVEALLRSVDNDPARIGAITWDGAQTKDGRQIERQALRESMRSVAYSDEGWQKYLGTLPRIEQPERQ